jgi:hypothetical protein
LIPLRALKADRNAVAYEQIKVSAVIDSGFNVEGIASFDSEARSISVKFDWLVYLSHCERREGQRKDRNQN